MNNPLIIEIYDEKVIAYIKERCSRLGITPLQYIGLGIKKDYESQQQVVADDIERLVNALASEYYQQYEQRFGLKPSDENGDGRRAIFEVVYPMVAELNSVPKTEAKLRKAVVWYLNFHNNANANGQNFPYGLKYLFSKKNPWLLRTCIESSVKLDDKMFKLMQEGKLTREEAIRAIKRGDTAGSQKQTSVVGLLDQALRIYADIRKQHGTRLPKSFKFQPQIDLLFKAETPDEDYIRDAIDWLNGMKQALEAKYQDE